MSGPESVLSAPTDFRIDDVERLAGTRTIVMAVHGDTDMHVVDDLGARLSEVLGETPAALVLDLSGVTFLDSTALGALLGVLRQLSAAGGRLRIVVPRPEIRRIFEITLLDRLFDIDTSREEALAAISSPA